MSLTHIWEHVGNFPVNQTWCSICHADGPVCIVPSRYVEDWLFETMCETCLNAYFQFVNTRRNFRKLQQREIKGRLK